MDFRRLSQGTGLGCFLLKAMQVKTIVTKTSRVIRAAPSQVAMNQKMLESVAKNVGFGTKAVFSTNLMIV